MDCEPICRSLAALDAEIARMTYMIWACWTVAAVALTFGVCCYVKLLRRN